MVSMVVAIEAAYRGMILDLNDEQVRCGAPLLRRFRVSVLNRDAAPAWQQRLEPHVRTCRTS